MKNFIVPLALLVLLSGCTTTKSDSIDETPSFLEGELKQCTARSEEQYQAAKKMRECIFNSWTQAQDEKVKALDEFNNAGNVLNSYVDEDLKLQRNLFECLDKAEKNVPFYPSIIFTPS